MNFIYFYLYAQFVFWGSALCGASLSFVYFTHQHGF